MQEEPKASQSAPQTNGVQPPPETMQEADALFLEELDLELKELEGVVAPSSLL